MPTTSTTPTLRADLGRIFDAANQDEYERTVGDEAGLNRKLRRRYVHADGCRIAADGGGVLLELERDGASLECVVDALGLPGDWADYDGLRIAVQAGDVDLRLSGMVLAREQRLVHERRVAAGETATVVVPLHELALANQSRDPSLSLYQVVAVKLEVQWGDSWPDDGELLIAGRPWAATADNAPTSLRLLGVELIPCGEGRDEVVVDRYGQCRHADPATLVRDDAELVADREAEGAALAGLVPPAGRSRFGGLVCGLRFQATGFFRVERDGDDRWWYVDPEGHPYWGFGFCCASTGDSRIILDSQRRLYDELPDPEGPYGSAIIARPYPGPDGKVVHYPAVSFYHWNALRKYGTVDAWHERMMERFQRWGVNTIGNWSVGSLCEQRQIPHCRPMLSRFDDLPRIFRTFPDVFHPEWAVRFDARCAETCTPHRDNPWLIGWFVDNEQGWGGLDKGGFLSAGPATPVVGEFVRFARERYGAIAAFNSDFATAFGAWDEVRQLRPEQVPTVEGGLPVLVDFAVHFAERYFSVVSAALKRHAPNHLYLGCRFVRRPPHPAIVATAGKYVDVLSVNCYDLWPREEEFGAWHAMSGGRPIQLGEFGLPGESGCSVRPNFPVFSAESIGRLAAQMGEKWAKQPWSVGVHWFPWLACCGDLDRPSPPFVDAICRIARELPAWRSVTTQVAR